MNFLKFGTYPRYTIPLNMWVKYMRLGYELPTDTASIGGVGPPPGRIERPDRLFKLRDERDAMEILLGILNII